MLADTIRALDADVERLLVAGGGSASSDEGLRKSRDAFAQLGEKVPALKKVAEQIDTVAGAKSRDAARELLNLSAMNLRLRGAQLATARVTETVPVPAAAPIETPLGSHEAEPLFRALTRTPFGPPSGSSRLKPHRVIEDAAERGAVHDLRLMDLWVDALKDAQVGRVVEQSVIPRLGEAVIPRLLSAFKMDGTAVDARRLSCVARVRGKAAVPLLTEALEKGSVPVRAQAILSLADIDIEHTEPIACSLFEASKNKEVRAACVRAIGTGKTERGLGVLVKALSDAREVRRPAVIALQVFPHADTTARVFALLTPETLAISPYKPPKAKKGVTVTPSQQKALQKAQQEEMSAISERVVYVQALLEVLAARPTEAIVDKLIELWRDHPMSDLRISAGEGMRDSKSRRALAVLIERLGDDEYQINELALDAFFLIDPATAVDRAAPYFEPAALADKKKKRPVAVGLLGQATDGPSWKDPNEEQEDEEAELGAEASPAAEAPPPDGAPEGAEGATDDDKKKTNKSGYVMDPRWADVALRMIGVEGMEWASLGVIKQSKDRRALDPLLALLAKNPPNSSQIISTLADFGDKRVVPVIVKLLSGKELRGYPHEAIEALKKLDDPSCLTDIQELLKKAKKNKNRYQEAKYEDLISYLERDRTLS